MSITAKKLGCISSGSEALTLIIKEHLEIIDAKLLRADRKWGRNVVAYGLPINIEAPGLSKQQSQRIVYSSIIKNLTSRGFKRRISIARSVTTLYIAWMTDLSQDEVLAMNAIISSSYISPQEIPQFIEKKITSTNQKELKVKPAELMHRGGTATRQQNNNIAEQEMNKMLEKWL